MVGMPVSVNNNVDIPTIDSFFLDSPEVSRFRDLGYRRLYLPGQVVDRYLLEDIYTDSPIPTMF